MRWPTRIHSTMDLLCWILFMLSSTKAMAAAPDSMKSLGLLMVKQSLVEEAGLMAELNSTEFNEEMTEIGRPEGFTKKTAEDDDAIDTSERNFQEIQTLEKTSEISQQINNVVDAFKTGSKKSILAGLKSAGQLMLKARGAVVDVWPEPITKGLLQLQNKFFGTVLDFGPKEEDPISKQLTIVNQNIGIIDRNMARMDKKLVNVNKKLDTVNGKLDTVDSKLDNVTDSLEAVTISLDDIQQGLGNITFTQEVQTEMMKEINENLKSGFEQLSSTFTSKLNELQVDLHENMLIQVVKIPARDLNRGVTALMTETSKRSASYMRHLCESETPSRVFSAILEYVLAPKGYFERVMTSHGYSLDTFYSLKFRIREILQSVIFAETICTSLYDLKEKKLIAGNQISYGGSVILNNLANEYDNVMKDINKKRNWIIEKHWKQIPMLVEKELPKMKSKVSKQHFVGHLENTINDKYAFKTHFFLTAGTIDLLFVDDGSFELQELSTANSYSFNNFFCRIAGNSKEDFIVYRRFTNGSYASFKTDRVEKKYTTQINEDKSDWKKLISAVEFQGTMETPILYMVTDASKKWIVSEDPHHKMKWVPVARNKKQTLLQLKHS